MSMCMHSSKCACYNVGVSFSHTHTPHSMCKWCTCACGCRGFETTSLVVYCFGLVVQYSQWLCVYIKIFVFFFHLFICVLARFHRLQFGIILSLNCSVEPFALHHTKYICCIYICVCAIEIFFRIFFSSYTVVRQGIGQRDKLMETNALLKQQRALMCTLYIQRYSTKTDRVKRCCRRSK